MVYAARKNISSYDYDYGNIELTYKYMDFLIKIADIDEKYFNNFLNFSLHNLLVTSRIVTTDVSPEFVEFKMLEEDYTKFMKIGFEQDYDEEGPIAAIYHTTRIMRSAYSEHESEANFEMNVEATDDERIKRDSKLNLQIDYSPNADP
jgi:hypothetical protein